MQNELAKFAGTSSVRIVKPVKQIKHVAKKCSINWGTKITQFQNHPKSMLQDTLCNTGNYVHGKSVNMEQMPNTRLLKN